MKGTPAYRIKGEDNIKSDIVQHGSVQAAFTVYDDLPTYKSGVYRHTSGSSVGGHSVTIIGWGTESGTPYWLVRNSWNTDWGDKGYFKIKRGNNECGIENQVSAGRYCEIQRKSCAGQVTGSVCATCDGDAYGQCADDGTCCEGSLCGGVCLGASQKCCNGKHITKNIFESCCTADSECRQGDKTCCDGVCCGPFDRCDATTKKTCVKGRPPFSGLV